jgi:hypothetical protein
MERSDYREFEARLGRWLAGGYQVLADDVDGELRITVMYVPEGSTAGSEREQEFWPMAPEVVQLLDANGIQVSRVLAGPHPWTGPHPADLEEIISQ